MKTYRVQPADTLSRVLCVLLALTGAAQFLNSIATFSLWQEAQFIFPLREDAQALGSFPTASPFATLIGSVASLSGIGAAVVWLIWQHTVTANLWARGFHGLKIRPGWAVGWWFIPFADWVMPFLAIREVDRRSTVDGQPRQGGGLVAWWWAAYLVSTVGVGIGVISTLGSQFGRFFDAVESNSATIDLTEAFRGAASWGVVGGVSTAVAAALAILVVQRITRNQQDVIRGPMPRRPDVDLAWMPAPPG